MWLQDKSERDGARRVSGAGETVLVLAANRSGQKAESSQNKNAKSSKLPLNQKELASKQHRVKTSQRQNKRLSNELVGRDGR